MSTPKQKNGKEKDKRKQQIQLAFNGCKETLQKQYKTMEDEIKDWGEKMTQDINQHVDEQIQALKVDCEHQLEFFNQECSKKLQFIRECGENSNEAIFNDILQEIESLKIEMASLRYPRKKLDWLVVNPSDDHSLNTGEEKETRIDKTSPRSQNDSHSTNQTTTQTMTTTVATPS